MKKNSNRDFFLLIFICEFFWSCVGQSSGLPFHWINAKLVRFNLINSNYVFPCNGLPLTPMWHCIKPRTTDHSNQNHSLTNYKLKKYVFHSQGKGYSHKNIFPSNFEIGTVSFLLFYEALPSFFFEILSCIATFMC